MGGLTRNFFVVFLLLSVSWSAFAIHGEFLPRNQLPPRVCAVYYFTDASRVKPKGHCTGTIIAPGRILTAAHCEQESEGSPASIYCGNDNIDAKVDKPVGKVGRREVHKDYTGFISPGSTDHDVAVLEFFDPKNTPGIQLAGSEKQIRQVLKWSWGEFGIPYYMVQTPRAYWPHCVLVGYGQDGTDSNAPFHGVPARGSLTITGDHIIEGIEVVDNTNFGDGGDSGSPLACMTESGQWMLVGTMSRAMYGVSTNYQSLSYNYEGIEKILDLWK